MTIGTGIFLSSLVIGTVILFVTTKDKWNWKKLFFCIFGIPLLLGLILAAGIYIHNQYQKHPRKLKAYWGVKLGISKEDVRFVKGKPTESFSEKDVDAFDYRTDSNEGYVIGFSTAGKVWVVSCYSGFCDQVLHVYWNDSVESLVKKLGEPSKIETEDNGLKRSYYYNQYNVFYDLKENKVVGMGIRDVDNLPKDEQASQK